MSDLVLDEMLGLRNPRDIAEIERLSNARQECERQFQEKLDDNIRLRARAEKLKAVAIAAEHLQATDWNDMKSMDAAQDGLWDALANLRGSCPRCGETDPVKHEKENLECELKESM